VAHDLASAIGFAFGRCGFRRGSDMATRARAGLGSGRAVPALRSLAQRIKAAPAGGQPWNFRSRLARTTLRRSMGGPTSVARKKTCSRWTLLQETKRLGERGRGQDVGCAALHRRYGSLLIAVARGGRLIGNGVSMLGRGRWPRTTRPWI
jgi:hypothetical protein